MATVTVTDETFATEVLDADLPVLVDYWAAWCAPCKMIAPILEEISEEFAGKIKIAKVDVDSCPRVQAQFRVQSLPTLMLFDGGQPVNAVQGALPKPALLKFLEAHVGGLKGPLITVKELDQILSSDRAVKLFDIRAPGDFSRSHLRHARCVPTEDLEATLADVPGDTLVVLIDRQGKESSEVAKRLDPQVKASVVALESGLLEWEGSGLPTYSDKEEAALDV